MNPPFWLDLSGGLDLGEAVQRLFAMTSATDYACSDHDFIAKGWKGEACRVLVADTAGFVTVHADAHCPRHTLWALERPEKRERELLQGQVSNLEMSLRAETARADRNHERVQELRAALNDVLAAALRGKEIG